MTDNELRSGEVYICDADNDWRRGPYESEAEARKECERLREAGILSDNTWIGTIL